jgi:predicted porin
MQKKLIALAVAGLASTAAFAQTNVTIYGIVDYGYSYRFDDRGLDSLTNKVSANGPNSSSRLDSGIQSGNRLGFKGTEDLGNGLKAVFLAEMGFTADTGYAAQGGRTFGRQIYAGLSGNFGTAVGGRLYTPYYTMMLQYDPFANGTMGAYSNVWTPTNIGGVGGLMNPIRVDNAVAYISPSFGGFTVTGAFSNNADGGDSLSNNAQNNTVYAIKGDYAGGAFTAGANYHAIQAGTSLAAVKNIQDFTLGLGYDFKFMKLTGVYSWNEADFSAAGVNTATLNNWLLGASAPFGKWTAKASYIYSDGNKAAGGDAQQLAIGADYALSKRTNLYSAYSWIDNSDQRLNGVGDGSNTGGYASNGTVADQITGANGAYPAGVFQQGFQVGLRHMF